MYRYYKNLLDFGPIIVLSCLSVNPICFVDFTDVNLVHEYASNSSNQRGIDVCVDVHVDVDFI